MTIKRGVLTVEALKSRCVIDPVSHCWLWQGAKNGHGMPKIWTLDYARVEKRCMTGPVAAWHISRNQAPRAGHLVFRCCQQRQCVNPVHMREAQDRAEIGLHIRRSGSQRGTHVEARGRNSQVARAARGIVDTPDHIVRAIRSDPGGHGSFSRMARLHGLSVMTVSKIWRGLSRAGVGA